MYVPLPRCDFEIETQPRATVSRHRPAINKAAAGDGYGCNQPTTQETSRWLIRSRLRLAELARLKSTKHERAFPIGGARYLTKRNE
jgi:hypothetical protein